MEKREEKKNQKTNPKRKRKRHLINILYQKGFFLQLDAKWREMTKK